MRTYLTNLLTWSTLINLVDILVVWYVIYRLIMLVRGTKDGSASERRFVHCCDQDYFLVPSVEDGRLFN